MTREDVEREADEILKKYKESTPPPTPPKEKPVFTNADIDKKRTELEVLRIENEIKRLSKPDIPETNYFKEMLAQQQQHFNQMMEMNKNQMELKLEIEKLKLMGEGGEVDNTLEYLQMLKPILPAIANNINKQNNAPTGLQTSPIDKEKEVKKKMLDLQNAAEVEEYKRKVRAGEIDEDTAWADFQRQIPKAIVKKLGREGFKKEFEKIKNETN